MNDLGRHAIRLDGKIDGLLTLRSSRMSCVVAGSHWPVSPLNRESSSQSTWLPCAHVVFGRDARFQWFRSFNMGSVVPLSIGPFIIGDYTRQLQTQYKYNHLKKIDQKLP